MVPFAPTQAASFSGPGKQAIALWAPGWAETLLAVLRQRPASYEACWLYDESSRAHVLSIEWEAGPSLQVALVDGVHNQLLAQLVKGAALALSPHRLYREYEGQEGIELFDPALAVMLPNLPSPLDLG
ncbi:MAG TPA: hypothetical protein VK191_15130 [Symbiobacteriaceae bacterium]|nr:hypothetical protein [Symbiobacteriaceae bacterium]